MGEIERCPFCKGENLKVKPVWKTYRFVACSDCKAGGPVRKTEEEAVAAWNERAVETCRMYVAGDPPDPSCNKSRVCGHCGAWNIDSEYYDADCHIASMKFCPECGHRVEGVFL